MLAVLTGWLLIQSALISPYPLLALNMVRGDWLVEILVATASGCAVLAYRGRDIGRPIVALVFALSFHVLLLLGFQIWEWAKTGTYPFGVTPFARYDYHSMLVTTVISLLLAKLLARSQTHENKQEGQTSVALSVLVAMLALSLIATTTLLARNAVIISMLMLLLSVWVFAWTGSRRFGKRGPIAVVGLLVASIAVSWIGFRSDPRWDGFSEAATIALDTKTHLSWLDETLYPRPLMKNGLEVDQSAYMRLAWGKVALEQIQRYPLGLGYGHKAFGWAVSRSYNVQTGLESSHSGLLDFTLANGIPGLILWLALSGSLIVTGWRAFRKTGSPFGLMLAFTVAAYLVRCLLDGHLSGFRLEMYALLVGALVMAQALESERCK